MGEWKCKQINGETRCELDGKKYLSLKPELVLLETPERSVNIKSNWTGRKSEVFIKLKR